MNRTAVTEPRSARTLRDAVDDSGPLRPLDPDDYAAGHALFEARSDQRERLTAWLVSELGARSAGPSRALSIGCGDGSVDVRVAAALAAGGQRVDYVGVEPHGPCGQAFLGRRLGEVAGVHATVASALFDDVRCGPLFDVVIAVHSLYYVDDLAGTLARACSLLAPGGVLVVLHAPCEPLNVFVRQLAPGRRQGWSDEVVSALGDLGEEAVVTRIDNRLDLTRTGDVGDDRALLEFTVQAHLPPAVEHAVRLALADQALPGTGLVVSHPVDAIVVRRS